MSFSNHEYAILEQIFVFDEGLRTSEYLDSEGNRTIGIGHLLSDDAPPNQRWSYQKCFDQLRADIDSHWLDAEALWPTIEVNKLGLPRRAALLTLVFNIGASKLRKKFFQTMPAIAAKDWDKAADLLMQSLWARQVNRKRSATGRDWRVTQMLRTDSFPEIYNIKG